MGSVMERLRNADISSSRLRGPVILAPTPNSSRMLCVRRVASNDAAAPLWRLPLFDAYERHLDGGYAAMSSTGASGYGGAITAALFLRRFAGKQTNWAHIDVMAWNLAGRPGRPKGGEAMGLRALFTYIERLAGH